MMNEGVWCKLDCNHEIHLNCMNNIIKKSENKKCPFCRSDIAWIYSMI